MKIYTAAQMRETDRAAIEEYGMPSLVLMENSGREISKVCLKWLAKQGKKRVLVLSGLGNNGGDGLVAARYLMNAGIAVEVLVLGNETGFSRDAMSEYRILCKMGFQCRFFDENCKADYEDIFEKCDLVLDAMYGTGFHGKLPENAAFLVQCAEEAKVPVFAVDIPSGVGADNGIVEGSAIKALKTITLVLPKPGLFLGQGEKCAGEVITRKIGMPEILLERPDCYLNMLTETEILPLLKQREKDGHKGTYGHVALIGGSGDMLGAIRMAGKSALRAGCGCATVILPKSLQAPFQTAEMELMNHAVSENYNHQFAETAADEIIDYINNDTRKNACVLGPGLGRYDEAGAFVKKILVSVKRPFLLDADGLMAIADDPGFLRETEGDIILTPHPGEMSALTGLSIAEIEKNRIEIARKYAREWQVTLVLKGHHSLIATKNGEIWMNFSGNPGMATGGSGDVLSGLIGGLLAQGYSTEDAAKAGVYLHGAAGDIMAKKYGEQGLIAGDLIEGIPKIQKKLIRKREKGQ